jgi:chemotaxis protein MotB
MERRGRPGHGQEHENHERWLVSYADFITLMFAFFVVMFASSQADKAKVATVSSAVTRALEEGKIPSKVQEMFGKDRSDKRRESSQGLKDLKAGTLAELTPSMRQLTAELAPEIRQGKLQITLEARGLVISLKEAAFFPPGDSTIAPEGYEILSKVAATIRKVPNPVRLEGHTDSIPIHNSRFANNWELSAARSIAMLQLLTTRYEVPTGRLAVVGYAETIAVDSNETADGRAKNRRVDVTILSEAAATKEPQPIRAD